MENLLRQLIQARSTTESGEREAAEVIASHFQQCGVNCHIDRWEENRTNVVAHVQSTGRRPALLFVCHLDVVSPGEEAWTHGPFEAHQANGRIYGRGAVDMKGGTTAAIAAICRVIKSNVELQGDVILAATAGEETDSAGIKRFMQDTTALPQPVGVIIPEPTDFAVVTAHRGLFWLDITTKGKAVHSSMPQRGVNAIMSMNRVLDALEHYEIPCEAHRLLGSCSVSVNTITGGEGRNIVPDRCTISIDIRTLPGQDHGAIRYDIEHLLARIKTEVPQFESELSVYRSVEAMETDPDAPFVQTFCDTVGVDMTNAIGYTTDAPYVAGLGAPMLIYGPGKPGLCHQVDEYIELADVEKAAEFYEAVIRQFLT